MGEALKIILESGPMVTVGQRDSETDETAVPGQNRFPGLDPSKPADLKETFTSRNIERIPSGTDYWPNPIFEKTMRNFYKRVYDTNYH